MTPIKPARVLMSCRVSDTPYCGRSARTGAQPVKEDGRDAGLSTGLAGTAPADCDAGLKTVVVAAKPCSVFGEPKTDHFALGDFALAGEVLNAFRHQRLIRRRPNGESAARVERAQRLSASKD
ncbi:MAG: hypothetical protein NZ585_14795 [Chloracidobacterium sp.]|nr:hypothetical protein [Chloracidobacterium sp.]MDW8217968.1 hypothetical protein [Acidobacteriota bacterium]